MSSGGYGSIREVQVIRRSPVINIILFIITMITTTAVGGLYANDTFESWPLFFMNGLVFSVPLMTILSVHEMGHYLAGRRRGLNVTLPFFIPSIPPLGTFGAFIKVRSFIPNKKTLMELGAWGPLSGAAVAIPLLFLGLWLSEATPQTQAQTVGISFGTSLILELGVLLRFGDFSFNSMIILHPTAMAAWFGLFVTAMNLLPMGQLDGGHVIYALFGSRISRMVSLVVFSALIPLGIFVWHGWLVFGGLTLLLGLRHPPPLDEYTPLDRSARLTGYVSIILFILTFVPAPVSVSG